MKRFSYSGPYPLPGMKHDPVLLLIQSRFPFTGDKLDAFYKALNNDIRDAVNDAMKLSGM